MSVAVVALALVVVVLVVERNLTARANAAERRRLVTAVIARHAGDVAAIESVERAVVPVARRRTLDPDLHVNEVGQIVDRDGQVVDDTAMVGINGN